MKDLTKIEQKQLRHLMQERKERLQQERKEDGEEDNAAEIDDTSLRESLIRQIAKGVSQLVVVAAFETPRLVLQRLDRMLIFAQLEELEVVLCLNKIDLLKNRVEADKIARVYRKLEYPVLLTSAATGEGLTEVRHKLEKKRSVLMGECGVGKTTLLKAFDPNYAQKQAARQLGLTASHGRQFDCTIHHYKFAHATEVLEINGEALQEHLQLAAEEVHRYFPEFLAPSRVCISDDCLHLQESDCGVKQAVEDGAIAGFRYQSYLKIVKALRENRRA